MQEAKNKPPADPMDDPANKEWVAKQLLAEAKAQYGEDFGEDIDVDFSE